MLAGFLLVHVDLTHASYVGGWGFYIVLLLPELSMKKIARHELPETKVLAEVPAAEQHDS